MPTDAIALASKTDRSLNRWTARIGLAVVMLVLATCFGVLIASSRASNANHSSTPAAATAR